MSTLKDIGAELGLSVATVSRALNGFPEVSAKTRARVRDAALRLGYQPNRIAQRLVTGRSGMVGMIVRIQPDMSADPSFFETLTGLTAALAARDVDLVLAVDRDDDPVAPYARMLEKGMLDGFVLNAPVPDDPRVAFLRTRGIPFVLHGQTTGPADYPFYDIDNATVSGDQVSLLTALGHRRLALLNGEARLAYAAERARGFRAALASEGLAPVAVIDGTEAPPESFGYTEALALLTGRHGPRPTAILCATTLIAAGVLRAARDLRLAVPADLSVMAHDDGLPRNAGSTPGQTLSVTRAPLREACVPLANALVDRVGGVPVEKLQTLVRASVVVGDSTGPAPLL
ncbi:MAG: LacI family DNA-binding transcriptional regulator [Limimaricola sp.]|uniref:LacI family DNA-binding transcriptional regulator n=1 Tax=Limimaricola sp. TaxID=2211665 RepID=UPI001DAC9FDC|nr:substrate-binding domain-containing protein [Limimaricola sp.]MBI1417655.1 LacI family DNA-binding transcriptional regulator [Limimaricola sp.]